MTADILVYGYFLCLVDEDRVLSWCLCVGPAEQTTVERDEAEGRRQRGGRSQAWRAPGEDQLALDQRRAAHGRHGRQEIR